MTRLLLCAVLLAELAHAQPYPRVASYANTQGGGYPLVRTDGTIDSAMVRALARFPVVSLPVNTLLARPDLSVCLRYYNPRVQVLGYQLITHWYLPASFVPRADDKTFAASWHNALRATNGFIQNAPDGYEVAWQRWDTADTLTTLLSRAAASGAMGGVFCDYSAVCITWTGASTPANDSLRFAHFRTLTRRLRAAGGPGLEVHSNSSDACGRALEHDAYMLEGYPDALTSLSQALKQRDGDWLKGEGPISNRAARFVLGTACMTGAMAAYASNRSTDPATHDARHWYPEFSVRPDGTADTTGAHVGWLGDALGPYYWLPGGLLRRDFQNGTVILNPTTSVATGVDLAKALWRRVPGTNPPERVFTIGAKDALFLQRIWRATP